MTFLKATLFFTIMTVCFSCTEKKVQEKAKSNHNPTISEIASKNQTSTPEILKPFEKEAQVFSLSGEDPIVGQEGTILKVRRENLEFEDGTALKATDKVSISLKEFYKVSDMLQAGLSTMSDKGLLESGGMVHVSASSAGKTLKLKAGRSFEISFAPGKHEGMSLYYGKQEQQQGLLWKKAEDKPTHSEAGFPFPQVGTVQSEEEYYQSLNETGKKLYDETKKLHKKFDANKFTWLTINDIVPNNGEAELRFDNDTSYFYNMYAVIKGRKAIVPAYFTGSDISSMQLFPLLPVGEAIVIVGFRTDKKELYEFTKTEIVLTSDSTVHLNFEAKTPEEIEASLVFLD